jgi:hypothetical protein
MTLTPERIAELRALDAAAANAPWKAESPFTGNDWLVCSLGSDFESKHWAVVTDGVHASDLRGCAREDAALIAAARNALPELLDEIERLRAILEPLRVPFAAGLGDHREAIIAARNAIAEMLRVTGGEL